MATLLQWPRGAIQLSTLIPSKLDNFQFPKLYFSKIDYFQTCIFPNLIISEVVDFTYPIVDAAALRLWGSYA